MTAHHDHPGESMRHGARAATTVLLSIAVTLGVPAVAGAAVVPDELPRGKYPQVAWFDHERRELHAGARVVKLDVPGLVVRVEPAATGHLIELDGRRDRLVRLLPDGRTQLVARHVHDWEVLTGPDAGRRVAIQRYRDDRLRVDVTRLSDRRVVATRVAHGSLFDFHRDRVWLNLAGDALHAWDARTGALRRVGPTGTIAVEARLGTAVRRQGGCGRFVPIRRDAGWAPWCAEHGVYSWSPDGRRVLTHTIPDNDDTGVARRILVRNARTGKLRQHFTGYFDDEDARWETNRDVLVRAADPDHDGAAAVVRLRLDGWAARASRLGGSFPFEAPVLVASSR